MIGGSIAGRVAADAVISGDLQSIKEYEKKWHDRLGKRHEMFNRIKNGIYNLSDDKYNGIAHALTKIPQSEMSLGNIAKTAVKHQPSLLFDVARTFFS